MVIYNMFNSKTTEKICDTTIEEIKELVKNPEVEYKNKNDVPLLYFAEFKDDNKRRSFDNLKSIDHNWIGLDFDGGYSMLEWQMNYSDYHWILYTTWSHSAQHEKFRVLLNVRGIHLDLLGKDVDEQKRNWKYTLSQTFPAADKNAMDWVRGFFLPSKRPEYSFMINEGIPFKLYMQQEPTINKAYEKEFMHRYYNPTFLEKYMSKKSSYNVENNEKVQHYLNTAYTKIKGNGDSDHSFMTAVAVCVSAKDNDTLEKVCAKARREHWKESEIQRKIDAAKKFIGRN